MKVLFFGVLIWAMAGCGRAPARAHGPLRQEVYVWQRSWGESAPAALGPASARVDGFTALAAEVSWEDDVYRAVQVPLDYAALQATGRPVGLALRLGPYPGPFQAEGAPISRIADLALDIVKTARRSGLAVRELQIDFDCAEAKLAGYRVWVEAIRKRIAPVPVVITVLPSWLKRSDFKTLVRAASGFVLQVHSLEPPRGPDAAFTLCDPAQSRQWIEAAGKMGAPFRVALPTYGYLMAFDPGGKLAGLLAEGPAPLWPVGTRLREVRADPAAMAGLVQALTKDRPAHLEGVIWYRLPVPGDSLNWPWPTLVAVMAGRPPRSRLLAEAQKTGASLVDVWLKNEGETDEAAVAIVVRWTGAELVAGDGLRGFTLVRSMNGVELRRPDLPGAPRLSPGETWPVGWLRFDRETEVMAHVEPKEK